MIEFGIMLFIVDIEAESGTPAFHEGVISLNVK